jgi:ActR/RegA family two-component response regulator
MLLDSSRSALIIEDDPFFSGIVQRFLAPWGLEIVVTDSVTAAQVRIDARRFDLYIVDLQLTDGDSSDLLARLATLDSTNVARCVVVTSFPLIANALTEFPTVDKTQLTLLGPHLRRILGSPTQE